jgi:enhancer of polycomb-like protein
LRLQNELSQSLALAEAVVLRERAKLDCAREAQNVWEKRLRVVDLKRKFPTLGEKADEELLQDKERPPKVPRVDTTSWVFLILAMEFPFWLF